MASNVISRPVGVAMQLNVITNIHKYRGFHEGHHFIPMAMEVHDAFEHDMDRFIKDCAHFFHDKQSRGHLSLYFYIQFFKQRANIVLQHALAFAIDRKIVLVGDVCSRPPITITSHNLHTQKGSWVKKLPTMKRTNSLPFFSSYELFVFWHVFGVPFLSPLSWF